MGGKVFGVIFCLLYSCMVTFDGRYLSSASFRFTSPRLAMSPNSSVVNVFVTEAISNTVPPFTFVVFL